MNNLKIRTMVKTFGKADEFVPFMVLDEDIYRVAWAKTLQEEKDEEGHLVPSSLCNYMLERYDYKPSMDIVLGDILASGEQASLQEIQAICEGLEEEPLEYLKRALLAYLDTYDESPAVNSFFIDGRQVSWNSDDSSSPNKSVRMGLRQNIADKMTKGEDTITLWMGGAPITVSCKMAEALMCNLEDYAYECFNVTASHRSAITELATIEEVMRYDYRTGYPEKLKIEL